jgi:hypothetical protein
MIGPEGTEDGESVVGCEAEGSDEIATLLEESEGFKGEG